VRLSSRRSDDADLIRARLRVLLDESRRVPGWVPEDDPEEVPAPRSVPTAPAEEVEESPAPTAAGRHRAPTREVRLDPGRRGARGLWIAGLLAALLLVAWTWLDRPRVEPVEPAPTAASASTAPSPATPAVGEAATTATTVVVSVVGLVARPGLVTVPTGARIADAVEAAGGLLPEADPASVNLAAVVSDGQQIAVGVPAATPGPGAAPAGGAGSAGGAAPGPVNLNSATAADLDQLPGIGPVLAQRIVTYREQQGRFTAVEQLDDVPGIGPAVFERLWDLVTV
jgi:competence protein ComEA